MSSRFTALVVAVASFAALRWTAAAELSSGTLELDPARTRIEFRLPGSLHTTHGTFKLERGMIRADLVSGDAGGEIAVDATSGSSGLGARDRRMKDAILEAEKFPRIQFVPKGVDAHVGGDGRFQAKLRGVLTLHGAEHEMTIDAEGHLNDQQVDATCTFSIPYVEWGLADPSLPLLSVSKQVEIQVTTAGHVVW